MKSTGIAVCGTSIGIIDSAILKKSRGIGAEIARNGHTLLFGACLGYPYESAKGAFENKGEVIGFSPAKNREEHTNVYGFPLNSISKIEYTGLGIPGRNLPLINNSDSIIIISGQIGTLNEFTIAFHQKKPIGILTDSGGITKIIDKIVEICDNENYSMKNKIVFSENPKEIIKKIIDILKMRT